MKRIRIVLILLVLSFSFVVRAQVIQAEYFWGSDPGQGSATPILAADGNLDNIVETLLTNAAVSPGTGVHRFSIRIKDEQNNWGPVFSTVITVENAMLTVNKNITQAEWFWNNDPGTGSGNVILALDGNMDNAVETLLKSDLQCPGNGINRFRIRIKDAQGTWGPVFTMMVSCETMLPAENQKVSQAEWFWGSDPGQGNGNTVLAFDGNFSDAFETLLQNGINCPSTGMNKFQIRIKDAQNTWGPVFSWIISCENLTQAENQKVAQAEWFWDVDPGQGNASPILAHDGNFSDAVESLFSSSLTPPTPGLHKFCVRIKDFQNNWGPVNTYIVSYENSVTPDMQKLIQAEYFWDSDPGQGSATPIMTMDGAFDQTFEYLFNAGIATNGITAGHHKFSIRVKDNQNNWGPVFSQAIFFEDCPAPVVNLGNDTTLCDAANITLNAGSGFTSYMWNTGATSQTLLVTTPGVYSVTAVHSSGCTRSDAISITAQNHANLGNDVSGCPGTSHVLTPGTFDSYLWTGGTTLPTLSVNPSSTTTYSVTVSDDGCISSDNITINVYTPPVVGYTGDDEICMGEQTLLNGTGAVSYIWSGGINNGMPFTPASSQTYTVTGTDNNGCTGTATVSLIVYDLPTVGVNGNTEVCQGHPVTLSGTGADTYIWDNGVQDGVPFYPQPPYTYLVTGTDSHGCSAVYSVTLIVLSNPSVTITGDFELCEGEETTLTASGNYTYEWSGGIQNGVPFIPQPPYVYNLTVTDAFGCFENYGMNLIVHALPTVNLALIWNDPYQFFGQDTLCNEAWDYVISGGTPAGGIYSGIGVTGNDFNPYGLNFWEWYTITYSYTDGWGCSASASDSVYIELCEGVEMNPLSAMFTVYPNPAGNTLFVNSSSRFIGSLVLTTTEGREIKKAVCNGFSAQLDLTGIASGVYFLIVESNDGRSVFRVVKE